MSKNPATARAAGWCLAFYVLKWGMIRIKDNGGWTLIAHPDHARLAGDFARVWRNPDFSPPEPLADVLTAVTHHDDAWIRRDAQPFVTREGRPSAFSHELVGTYSAFEEIDLADYLNVRGEATESVARRNAYAAIVVSMHTVDLLTAQADLSKLSAGDLALHGEFVAGQRRRQRELAASCESDGRNADVAPEKLQRAFEFLQACDSLSLIACVRYPRTIPLRHTHPRSDGTRTAIQCEPLGNDTYRLSPYPFEQDKIEFRIPCRQVPGETFASLESFRGAWAAAAPAMMTIKIVR